MKQIDGWPDGPLRREEASDEPDQLAVEFEFVAPYCNRQAIGRVVTR